MVLNIFTTKVLPISTSSQPIFLLVVTISSNIAILMAHLSLLKTTALMDVAQEIIELLRWGIHHAEIPSQLIFIHLEFFSLCFWLRFYPTLKTKKSMDLTFLRCSTLAITISGLLMRCYLMPRLDGMMNLKNYSWGWCAMIPSRGGALNRSRRVLGIVGVCIHRSNWLRNLVCFCSEI